MEKGINNMDFKTFMEFITKNKTANTQEEFDIVTRAAEDIFKYIEQYIRKHNTALSCGSEWMYQDDNGQVDALSLVGDILDRLNEFADNEDE